MNFVTFCEENPKLVSRIYRLTGGCGEHLLWEFFLDTL